MNKIESKHKGYFKNKFKSITFDNGWRVFRLGKGSKGAGLEMKSVP